jgi:hypothetical protein
MQVIGSKMIIPIIIPLLITIDIINGSIIDSIGDINIIVGGRENSI